MALARHSLNVWFRQLTSLLCLCKLSLKQLHAFSLSLCILLSNSRHTCCHCSLTDSSSGGPPPLATQVWSYSPSILSIKLCSQENQDWMVLATLSVSSVRQASRSNYWSGLTLGVNSQVPLTVLIQACFCFNHPNSDSIYLHKPGVDRPIKSTSWSAHPLTRFLCYPQVACAEISRALSTSRVLTPNHVCRDRNKIKV